MIYIKKDSEYFVFKISLPFLISTRLIDQLASRGNIPPTTISIELDWNKCTNYVIASAISSGESWNKLFVPEKITFFRLERFWARHKIDWMLSSPIPQFSVFRGPRYFFQTIRYLLNPASIKSCYFFKTFCY